MSDEDIFAAYFAWLCNHVLKGKSHVGWYKLLKRLYETQFTYTLPMDDNREADGRGLRYRFLCETRYGGLISEGVSWEFQNSVPCSVLEMMIALALRCEEHIMHDNEIGDRTSKWFWEMVGSLGLGGMFDSRYDQEYVDHVLERFLRRDYEPNGRGGLFTVDTPYDMRDVDIWYQAMFYINSIL